MGCGGSKATNVISESPLSKALERKLINAVVSTKRRKSFVVKKSSFNHLMLQLPKLTAGFKKIREAYAKACSPSGKVTWGAFRAACGQQLGLDPASESLKEVLDMPDVSDSVLLTHADLIVIFTVVYLIDGATKRRTLASPEVRSCLELMEKSFMFFDSSADGCIERKELALALKSGTRVFGRHSSKSLADRLFDQLDWSKDGQITFKEYLVGMERIIIETAGEEEDDDIQAEEEEEEEEALKEVEGDWGDEGAESGASLKGGSKGPTTGQQQQLQQEGSVGGVAGKEQEAAAAETVPALSMLDGVAVMDEVRPFTNTGMTASTGDEAAPVGA